MSRVELDGCAFINLKNKTIMKGIKVSKQRAIELTMNLNGVTREMAERYTDSELREVLRLLKLKANF
jgi:hypothetical protein